MADRLAMRGSLGGVLAGFQPLIDRALGVASCGQMMCEELRLAFDNVSEMLLEHGHDAGMQFLPPAAQQGAVGGILHQRVLEEIGGLRRDSAAEQQPGLGKAI